VPFLRFTRDKRGYEHTYLVETFSRRGKPARTRILYWFRTPPGVRVGRVPFDPEVRQAIEERNPGIQFDWPTIIATPMPAPEPEPWWERRRAERIARQARRADDREPETALAESPEPEELPAATASEPEDASELEEELAVAAAPSDAPVTESASTTPPAAAVPDSLAGRRRRRRGGRRRGRRRPDEAGSPVNPGANLDLASETDTANRESESLDEEADPSSSSSEG
jgi:hypothetical protein